MDRECEEHENSQNSESVPELSDEDIGELISNDDDHFSTSNVKRDDSLKRVRFYESIEIREFTNSHHLQLTLQANKRNGAERR